jgi:hypothetical protein
MKKRTLKEVSATSGMYPGEAQEPNNVSLDQAVDKLLVQYERESAPAMQRLAELRKFIFEEGEDDAELGPDVTPSASSDINIPPAKINIPSFATMVARLVENRDTLLDPKTIIAARAVEFIKTHYNQTVANELLNLLENQYKLSVRPRKEVDGNTPGAPLAVGAAADIGG